MILVWAFLFSLTTTAQDALLTINRAIHEKPYLSGKPFKSITLEMSLKPFKKNEPEAIRAVCREVFTQWSSLLRHADVYLNADRPWRTGKIAVEQGPAAFGHCFVVKDVSGKLVVSW